jgi:hypothetical protein
MPEGEATGTASQLPVVSAQERIQLLQREAQAYQGQMRALYSTMYSFIGAGITLGVAAASFLAEKGRFDVLLAIPLLVPLIWLNLARMIADSYAMAAHRYQAEQTITILLRKSKQLGGYRPWDEAGGKEAFESRANLLFFGSLALMSVALIVGSIWAAWRYGDLATGWYVATLVSSALLCGVTVWAVVSALTVYDKTLRHFTG